MSQAKLTICPITQREAVDFVKQHHRHHPPSRGAVFCLGVIAEGDDVIRGVAMAGRPVARPEDDGWTLEILRVATDGCENACSCLYGAVRRVGFAMGYKRIITYTLSEEPGTSLVAAGWTREGKISGRSWDCPGRPRVDRHPLQDKIRWAAPA